MKRIVCALLILLCIAYFPIFFGKTWYFGDTSALFMPGKLVQVEALRAGQVPLWNPYVLGGMPLFADISQSLIYPSTLVFTLVRDPALALKIVILTHFLLTAVGMYVLSRKLKLNKFGSAIAAVLWVMSAPIVFTAQNFSVLQSAAWIPWFVAAMIAEGSTRGRWLMMSPVFILLLILGGHPQPLVYAGIIATVFLLFFPGLQPKQKMMRILLSGVFAAGIGAIVFIPFVELVGLSTRSVMTATEVLKGSLNPTYFIQWLIPNFFSEQRVGMLWGPAWDGLKQPDGYLGWIALFSIATSFFWAAKKQALPWFHRACLWLIGISLIMMVEGYIPGVAGLVERLPFLRLIRTPSMAMMIWVFATAITTGAVLSNKKIVWRKFFPALRVMGVGVTLLLVLLTTFSFWFHPAWMTIDSMLHHALSRSAFHTPDRDAIILLVILKQLCVSATFFLAVLVLLAKAKHRWIIVALIFCDLWFAVWPSLQFAPNEIYSLQSEAADAIQSRGGVWNVLSTNDVLPYSGLFAYFTDVGTQPPFAESRYTLHEKQSSAELKNRIDNLVSDWNAPYNLPTPFGYSAFVLRSTASYWKDTVSPTANTANINGVDQVSLQDERLRAHAARFLIQDTLIYPSHSIDSHATHFHQVAEGTGWALLEDDQAQPFVHGQDVKTTVKNTVLDWNSLKFDVSTLHETDLEVAQTWYPGWRCMVNQGTCSIQDHDGWMQLHVSGGEQAVRLSYLPSSFQLAAMISLISLLGWMPLSIYLGRSSARMKAL